MNDMKFILLDTSDELVSAWKRAFREHTPTRDNFTFVHSKLQDLPTDVQTFDCIVSPANSYGRLDGGFDYYLAESLAPPDHPGCYVPTKIVQQMLYKKWKGFAPPGTCTLIPLKDTRCFPNQHSCRFIALCPTMRVPEPVTWDREIVYNCVWSLLAALTEYNDSITSSDGGAEKITSVLMTGFAAGIGEVSVRRCAQQMALAFRDFFDACENPDKWSSMDWDTAFNYAVDTRRTHDL